MPEITNAFLEIAAAPSSLSDNCLRTTERFAEVMYDRGSELHSVDEARQHLFCKHARGLDRIPPISAALKQHVLRASYQGGHVWSQVHLTLPELPSPAEWGWRMDGNHCGQLCNKPSKAGTSSSVVPVRRHVKGYAGASREACSVQLYVLVVDTTTAS